MRKTFLVLAAALAGCAGMTGRDEATAEFEKEARAADALAQEDKARAGLGAIEAAIAGYVKAEGKAPETLEKLVPKHLGGMPFVAIPACGADTDKVEYYPPETLRDGQVDGTKLNGTGRWGYVRGADRVVVFVDCLKVSGRGVPWYQERGVF